jgi:hypothetical protein
LILSGFPFQIKLWKQDSISFMYIFGAKKINFGRMSVFKIRIFPIIVRFLFPHVVNWFFISSIFFSQLSFWHSSLLCPKNIPNALTGFCVHLIPLILSLQFFSLPYGVKAKRK